PYTTLFRSDEDQLIVVIAVHHFDVDAGIRHSPRDLPELSRHVLPESLHQYFALGDHLDSGFLERFSRRGSVGEKKMGDRLAITQPCSAALDAYARLAERIPHFSQSAGP